MSSLVRIAKLKSDGQSLDEIVEILSMSPGQIRVVERIGVAKARALYHRANSLSDVALGFGISLAHTKVLDEVYHISTSKPPEKTLALFDLKAFDEQQRADALTKKKTPLKPQATQNSKKTSASQVPQVAHTPQTAKTSYMLQNPQTPSIAQTSHTPTAPQLAIETPLYTKPADVQLTFDAQITPPKKEKRERQNNFVVGDSYARIKSVLEPYARALFLTMTDAQALLRAEQVVAPTHTVRALLTQLSDGLTHGDRVRKWAKVYAGEGKTLVEISRLLGNQHMFATKRLLASLDLHVKDGFELIDYTQTLRNAQSLPENERKEIELICQGASYTQIATSQSYSATRAGQRIDELGLREVWQCAQYLKRAVKKPVVIAVI